MPSAKGKAAPHDEGVMKEKQDGVYPKEAVFSEMQGLSHCL